MHCYFNLAAPGRNNEGYSDPGTHKKGAFVLHF